MEANRLALREILSKVMVDCGEEPKLYYQPPESMRLEYPCMIYHLKDMSSNYADNRPYMKLISFDITYVTRSPSSSVPVAMTDQSLMSFDRYYTADNLHHYAYTYTTTLKEV